MSGVLGNLKSSGITPTIVRCTPAIVVKVPVTCGSDEKCRRHRLSLRSTTGGAPRSPSSGRRGRPMIGG